MHLDKIMELSSCNNKPWTCLHLIQLDCWCENWMIGCQSTTLRKHLCWKAWCPDQLSWNWPDLLSGTRRPKLVTVATWKPSAFLAMCQVINLYEHNMKTTVLVRKLWYGSHTNVPDYSACGPVRWICALGLQVPVEHSWNTHSDQIMMCPPMLQGTYFCRWKRHSTWCKTMLSMPSNRGMLDRNALARSVTTDICCMINVHLEPL